MQKITFFKFVAFILFWSISTQAFSQVLAPFEEDFNEDLQGEMLSIGNNTLSVLTDAPFNNLNARNNRFLNMQHIDIDGDASTFSSSSAELVLPNPECFEIRHAVLYWGSSEAVLNATNDEIRQIRFRTPTGAYMDLTGDIIHRQEVADGRIGGGLPYACRVDVTDIITDLPRADQLGFYTVANVNARTGIGNSANPQNSSGFAAGWTLFVVYEDPTVTGRSITSFEGLGAIQSRGADVNIPVSGFRTLPNPQPVRASVAFAAIEGDLPVNNDRLQLNGTNLSAVDRPGNSFFRSAITRLDATPVNNRIPNGTNTLGFDTGIVNVQNPGNIVLGNDETDAVITLNTGRDFYFQYFVALSVEIIEPDIVLTKIVEDEFGDNIGDEIVELGQELSYVISIQNIGNDDAQGLVIRDILPVNTVFDFPGDLILPSGINPVSYDPVTRELVLSVEDFLVEEGRPAIEFRIRAQVVEDCSDLVEACTNIVQNQAFASYTGTINLDFIISDDPSVNSNTGCLLVPQATNFLADIEACEFRENAVLCADSIDLTAADGFDTYSWSTDPSGTPVIATTQTLEVTEVGTYFVFNTAPAPCRSIVQIFDVTTFGANQENPILTQADQIVTCPDDGSELPLIFLCDMNDFRDLTADITDANSITWELLDETSCPAVPDMDCANRDDLCIWNPVATGMDFTVNTRGQYRLTVTYDGGCFNQFFFNVFQNVFDPSAEGSDVLCDTTGTITVTNVPTGYEYSLDGVTYQDSNVFSPLPAGLYTIFIRLADGIQDACVFTVPDVLIREREFLFEVEAIQPLCNGDRGSIQVSINNADPQYTFSIFEGGTLVDTVGPISDDNTHIFPNLGPGTYTATVDTDDGCMGSMEVTITEPDLLEVTADLAAPFIACLVQVLDDNGDPVIDDEGNAVFEQQGGQINLNATGGTPPYAYFINSTTEFQSSPVFTFTTPGTFDITVVDANNCEATTTIEVEEISAPDFTAIPTNIPCADSGDIGVIEFDVTNSFGSTLEYSIDGGITYSDSPVFPNLAAGTYEVVIRYTFGVSSCTTIPESVVITIPDPITGTASVTTDLSCTSSDIAVITVADVSGGVPGYTYSIDGVNFQAGTVFSNLTGGTYTVTIQDSNGCTFTLPEIVITPLNPPTDLDFSSTALSCPDMVSDVTLTAIGGVAPLEYRIIEPTAEITPYQTSNIFAGLAPNTYTFEVRDANECVYSEQFTINPLPAISAVAQTQSDVICVGGSDGTILVTVSGTTSFEYSVNGDAFIAGSSPFTLSGLIAGTYDIVIRDTVTNCETMASAIIEEPIDPLELSVDETAITCIQDGTAVITASGGWGGYSYTITQPDSSELGPQSSNTFTGLTLSGQYTATVTDVNGCEESTTFDLTTPGMVEASIATTSDVCFDATNGATLEVTVTSGEAPFEYSINGEPFQSNNIFDNLLPGTYTITVRDAFGCTTTLNSTTIANELTVTAVLTNDLDCNTTPPTALITGTINGGTAPFSYEVSVDGNPFTAQGTATSPFTFNTTVAGDYQFQIIDASGCIALSNVITINELSMPAIDSVVETQAIQCNGDSNGAFDVTIDTTVGTPPFVINVENTTSGTDFGTQTSGLPAGDYTITLTDANNCMDTDTITLAEPDPLVVDIQTEPITCDQLGGTGTTLGEIRIESISGGTPNYDIFVTGVSGFMDEALGVDGTTPVVFPVINFGLYQVNVIDDNGCNVLTQDILIASPPDDLDIIVETTVDCATGGAATVSVSTTLASPGPFVFAIFTDPVPVYPNPPGAWIPESPAGSGGTTFTGLIPGVTFTFLVFDMATGCTYFETAETPILTNSTLDVTAVDVDNVSCTGDDDGDVSFTITSIYNVDVTVDYEILNSLSLVSTGIVGSDTVPANGSITVSDLGPLPLGNYTVIVTETSGPNAGCGVATAPFNITESQFPLDLSVSVDQNANCNPDSGIITAIAQDGTPPYQYQITTTPAAPVASDPNYQSDSVFNVNAGTYFVHVLDAFGCIVTSPAQVVLMDSSPIVGLTLTNPCTAAEGEFEVDVDLTTVGIPPYSFSINGGAFQTQTIPFTISGLNSGPLTVEVRDFNGCSDSETITILAPLSAAAMINAQPSCDDNDGQITVNATGGSGNYGYTIAPNPPSVVQVDNVFSGLPSGSYTFTITDLTNPSSCTTTATATLEAAIPVTFDPIPTDVSCNGGDDGTITVELLPGNDNPVYTYELIAPSPVIVPEQNSNVFLGLEAGTYTVQVNSGRGCFETEEVIVGEPTLLVASGSIIDFSCAADNTVNTATLTITATQGTPPYSYSIDGTNFFTNNTFDIIDTGVVQTITVSVLDDNGCIATNTVSVDPLPRITAAVADVTSPIDCNITGEVTITVTGGSGNFEYILLPNGTPQTSNVFALSEPGTYFFRVNDLDTGCFFLLDPFEIAPFDVIEAVLSATQDIECVGDDIGTLELTISNYVGDYTYQLLDSDGNPVGGVVTTNTSTDPQVIINLAAGNYTASVVAIESPFCTVVSNSDNIGTPLEEVAVDASESAGVTCENDQGIITAIGDGGTPNYEYQLELGGAVTVPFSSNGVFEGLSAGTYIVTIRDANGCLNTDTVVLEEPLDITADFAADITELDCFGDQDATITITNVMGGQGTNYNYTLNRILPTPSTFGPQTSNVFPNLGAGTYSVTVSDAFSCELTSPEITITQPDQIDVGLVEAIVQTCEIDPALTLSATGGTPPYQYSLTEDFSVVIGTFTTSVTFDVPAPVDEDGDGIPDDDVYEYFVRDANGCGAVISNQITVNGMVPLDLDLDSSILLVNCTGDDTGSITAIGIGGLGDYVYTLQDESGVAITPVTQDSPGVFTGLPIGTYLVFVESGDCLFTSDPIEIAQPLTPLDADFDIKEISCSGARDGGLTITTSGGTEEIIFAISPNGSQSLVDGVIENLGPGTYEVLVQDRLGCVVPFEFTLTDPVPVVVELDEMSVVPAACVGDTNGSFSIEISGGSLPYSVSLDERDGPFTQGDPTQTIFAFNNVSGGNHTVFVIDSNGCETEWEIPFPDSVDLSAVATVAYDCIDNIPGSIVTVTLDDSVDSSLVTYSINGVDFQSSNVFVNLDPGTGYVVTVAHENGCVRTTNSFDIDFIDTLSLSLSNPSFNLIVAATEGGIEDYQYTFSLNGLVLTSGNDNTFTISETGTYVVTVTDAIGCTDSEEIFLEFVDVCIPNFFTPNGDGERDGFAPGCAQSFPNILTKIYDRYGREIAILRQGQFWDGTYNSQELPTGDYWYVVTLGEAGSNREFVGHFTLYR